MTAPNQCPNCGEFVSMFAAGCAICGTPLDPARARRRSLAERLRSLLPGRRSAARATRPS